MAKHRKIGETPVINGKYQSYRVSIWRDPSDNKATHIEISETLGEGNFILAPEDWNALASRVSSLLPAVE